jgi:bifunctional DNA-binding transcriptional regulator/antitoxin component of YhaV-PrlF toxin-antitoxin module
MTQSNNFVTVVEELPDGELYIVLPPEWLASVGWDETTTLEWIVENDSILLRKVEQ